ncbi:MAG TPA: hypothetical protein DEH10_21575 [Pseudomonas sp.]|uniref:hypothetical protein n=1 Tax=uncultured Pseudomonas sp. TaxID=114707 RepID=UPI000E8B21C9|nr:hypothetical protein [Pseudomonas sp.]
MLDIVVAELIEGNYVLYQGDLSTRLLEKLRYRSRPARKPLNRLLGLGRSAVHMPARLWPGPGK